MKLRLLLLAALLIGLLAACNNAKNKAELSLEDIAQDVHSSTITSLNLNEETPNLSGTRGTTQSFEVNVPSNATNLVIKTSGGTGDLDMYVRAGSAPTTSSYDCRPYKSGNNETCTFANPQTGKYYILLRAYLTYSGVTLSISYDTPSTPTPTDPTPSNPTPGNPSNTTLSDGVAKTGLSAAKSAKLTFTIEVPANATELKVTASGGTGDADLYVRRGSAPTTSSYDCRSYRSGNNESCTISSPSAGTYYVMLNAYRAFSGVSLLADYTVSSTNPTNPTNPTPGDNVLSDGVAKTGLSAARSAKLTFTIAVPANATELKVTASGGTGDADLYVRRGSAPTTSTYDCRSYRSGNNESCTISSPSAGTYYVMLNAYRAFSGISLVADYTVSSTNPTNPTNPTPSDNVLTDGVAKTGLSAASSASLDFTFEVPAGTSELKITSSGGTGDADLYVRRAVAPTTSSYDCRSYLTGNNETCTISSPAAGTYYIKLRAYRAFSGVSLLASASSSTEPVDTTYDIEFVFSSTVSEDKKALFRRAAARWQEVITGDIPDVTGMDKGYNACRQNEPAYNGDIDDLVIFVNVGPRDGKGGVLASAGPCLTRSASLGRLTAYGIMNFDEADSNGPELYETILHEMGHVIGIGTLWDNFELVNYSGRHCPTEPVYSGQNARSEWQTLGGTGNIPVEADGGPGTACGHWDEDIFDTELMTGYSEGSAAEPLSRMTIASLEDMGYTVNYAQADAYVLPTPTTSSSISTQAINIAQGERLIFPVGTVDADGTINNH